MPISQISNYFLFVPTPINFPQAKSQSIKGSRTEALKPDVPVGSWKERQEWGLLLLRDVLLIHSPGTATLAS